MTVTQYIGARYVPLFATPLEWDITKEYEPLTIVYWQGNSYTSRQAVPAQIDINNEAYWALTGNYNAQIEQYRREVKEYDARIRQNTTEIGSLDARMDSAESTLEKLGTAAKKGVDKNPTKDSVNLVESGGVYAGLQELDEGLDALKQELDEGLDALKDASDAIAAKEATSTAYHGKLGVFVSDSWGVVRENYGVTKPFPDMLGAKLGMDMQNVSYGGVGFCAGGTNNYYNRLRNWANQNPTRTAEVAYVFVEGSSNDVSYGEATVRSAIIEFVNYAIATFPNATIIMIPQIGTAHPFLPTVANIGADTTGRTYNSWAYCNLCMVRAYTSNRTNWADKPVICLNGTFNVLKGIEGVMHTDNIHPNQDGQNIIANWLAAYLLTGQRPATSYNLTNAAMRLVFMNSSYEVLQSNNITLTSVKATEANGLINIYANGTIPNVPSGCRYIAMNSDYFLTMDPDVYGGYVGWGYNPSSNEPLNVRLPSYTAFANNATVNYGPLLTRYNATDWPTGQQSFSINVTYKSELYL